MSIVNLEDFERAENLEHSLEHSKKISIFDVLLNLFYVLIVSVVLFFLNLAFSYLKKLDYLKKIQRADLLDNIELNCVNSLNNSLSSLA